MTTPRLAQFGKIDQTADADYFIRFLDEACAQPSMQAYKHHLIDVLQLRPGMCVLDVGCGTGDDVRNMAPHVAPGGVIVGVDNSQMMIAEAHKRAAGTGLPVSFQCADVLELPFADDHFDCSQADRSLMHVPHAEKALKEMKRVTKPGGRVAVFEVDFGALTIDVEDRMLGRKIINTWCESVKNGWLGRHMPALLTDLGLSDVRVYPYTLVLTPSIARLLVGQLTVNRAIELGAIREPDGAAWLTLLDDLERRGRFFSTMTGFLVTGVKRDTPERT